MRRIACFAVASVLAACAHHAGDGASSSADATRASSPELAPTSPGAAWSFQQFPAAASDGKDFLVVWSELPALPLGPGQSVLRAMRVGEGAGEGGALLDPSSLAIAASPTGADSMPSVAFDGHAYVVTWLHSENGATTVRAAHVGTDGKLVDATPIELGPADGGARPVVASDGAKTLVVWSNGSAIEGAYLGGSPFQIAAARAPRDMSVAVLNGTFLVAFDADGGAIASLRLDGAGTLLDAAPVSVAQAHGPLVATDGHDFLLTWTGGTGTTSCHVDPATGAHGAARTAASTTSELGALVYDGAGYVASGSHGLTRLDPQKDIVGGDASNELYVRQNAPALASNGRVTLSVDAYAELGDAGWKHQTLAASLTPTGATTAVLVGEELARSTAAQRSPAIAHGRDESLVVWIEDRDSFLAPVIRGAWMDPTGAWLGPAFDVQVERSSNGPTDRVFVVYDGAYHVSWVDRAAHETFVTQLRPRSTQEETAPQAYPGENGAMAVANGYLFLLAGGLSAVDDPNLRFPQVSAPAGAELVWNGSELVAAWTQPDHGVYVQRFTTDGHALDAAPVKVTTMDPSQTKLAVAADGAGTTFFAWPAAGSGLSVARLEHGGAAASAPVTQATTAPDLVSTEAALAFDGAHLVAAYATVDVNRPGIPAGVEALALDPATLSIDSRPAALERGFGAGVGLTPAPGGMTLTYSALAGGDPAPVVHVQSVGFSQ